MKHRSWTELFFLDEATALAAGHRPCFACRRVAAEQFRTAWAMGNGIDRPRARDMDRILHAERLMGRHKQLHLIPASPHDLPDGTMLASRQSSYLIAHGRFFRWNADGYEPIADVPNWDGVLTPPSTVRALQAGYKPILSPSAG